MYMLYLAKLYKERDNIGAPTTTKNAMSLLCSMNDVDPAPYNTLRVTAAVEAARRHHKHVVKKSAGLTVGMIWPSAGCTPLRDQGALASCNGNLRSARPCRWRSRSCCAHVRFYVEGRKNAEHGCALLDIARPADDNPDGIYFIIVR
jgi:hypothetical protein